MSFSLEHRAADSAMGPERVREPVFLVSHCNKATLRHSDEYHDRASYGEGSLLLSSAAVFDFLLVFEPSKDCSRTTTLSYWPCHSSSPMLSYGRYTPTTCTTSWPYQLAWSCPVRGLLHSPRAISSPRWPSSFSSTRLSGLSKYRSCCSSDASARM